MITEEIKKKYGIEPIMREMWVWNDDQEDAFLCFVIYKKPEYKYPYITINKDRYGDIFKNASDTNPNKTKEPKVGDKGYFWNDDGVFYAYGKLEEIYKEDGLSYLCEYLSWHRHFSHEKQPWMK